MFIWVSRNQSQIVESFLAYGLRYLAIIFGTLYIQVTVSLIIRCTLRWSSFFFFFLSSSKEMDSLVWNRMHIVIILLLQDWHINIKTSNQRLRLIHQSFWMQSLLTQVFNRSEMFSVYCTSKIPIRYKCNANTGELHRVKQIASDSDNRMRKFRQNYRSTNDNKKPEKQLYLPY